MISPHTNRYVVFGYSEYTFCIDDRFCNVPTEDTGSDFRSARLSPVSELPDPPGVSGGVYAERRVVGVRWSRGEVDGTLWDFFKQIGVWRCGQQCLFSGRFCRRFCPGFWFGTWRGISAVAGRGVEIKINFEQFSVFSLGKSHILMCSSLASVHRNLPCIKNNI